MKLGFSICLLLVAGASFTLASPFYAVTQLPDIDGKVLRGLAMNDTGQVVGFYYSPATNENLPFLYTPGVGARTLDFQGSDMFGISSLAYSINDRGQVVGSGNVSSSSFLYTPGIGSAPFDSPGRFPIPYAINDKGQITGYWVAEGGSSLFGPYNIFLYTPGVGFTDLGRIGSFATVGLAINDLGEIAGYGLPSGGFLNHAVLYTPQTGLIDITPDAKQAFAQAINDKGQVTGYDDGHAFLYTPGSGLTILDLGVGFGIDDSGEVVGSYPRQFNPTNAVIYMGNPLAPVLLSNLIGSQSATLTVAQAINSSGQILALAQDNYGPTYVLTPSDNLVPEPSTAFSLGLGALAIYFSRTLRQRAKGHP